jgi:Zn-dependent protease with chaperone function
MNTKTMLWLLCFVLSFIGFFQIEKVLTIGPGRITGNGNAGLLVNFIVFPLFLASLVLAFSRTRAILADIYNKKISVGLFFSAAACLITVARDQIAALGGTPADPDSKIFRFSWLNQYTNGLFFNSHTFLFLHPSPQPGGRDFDDAGKTGNPIGWIGASLLL